MLLAVGFIRFCVIFIIICTFFCVPKCYGLFIFDEFNKLYDF